MRKKSDLPQKTCTVCGRAFTCRRKWARDWEAVVVCSERCRRSRRQKPVTDSGQPHGAERR